MKRAGRFSIQEPADEPLAAAAEDFVPANRPLGLRILLAEDNKFNQKLIMAALASEKHQVRPALIIRLSK